MLMVFRGTNSTETYALPVARWQSRQWQLAVITGSAEHSYRTAPHIQPPVKGVAITELLSVVVICLSIRSSPLTQCIYMHYMTAYVNGCPYRTSSAAFTDHRRFTDKTWVRPDAPGNGAGNGGGLPPRGEKAFGCLGTQRVHPTLPRPPARD